MRFFSTFSAKTACAAVALSALASGASASEIRMHVPVAAKWGGEMLPAGDYKFELNRSSPVIVVSGNGKLATVFVTSVTPQPASEHGYLKIVDVHGTPTVAAFGSETEGVTFRFAIPKSRSRVHGAAAEEPAHGS